MVIPTGRWRATVAMGASSRVRGDLGAPHRGVPQSSAAAAAAAADAPAALPAESPAAGGARRKAR